MKGKSAFLALVGAQVFHSVEEYIFHVYDLFPPARFVISLISTDREQGFLIVNLAVIGFGVVCYWWPVRQGWPSAVPLAWLWVGVEFINAAGHPVWSLVNGRYTPGVATAVLLLLLAVLLAHRLLQQDKRL